VVEGETESGEWERYYNFEDAEDEASLNSGASLATVVGVLIEVPVMLSLVAIANKCRY
jgi:hypothetical protein